jgi:pyrroloquinoline quinone (PQQ) biosynthesis protein C
MLNLTPDPTWVGQLIESLASYEDRVVNAQIFQDIKLGSLSLEKIQRALVEFYPLVESFPSLMAIILSRVPLGDSEPNGSIREWLINNISVERLHTHWWKDWANDFGVPIATFDTEIVPPIEIDALNNYLWRTCTYRSIPEALAALNLSIEGATGKWSRGILEALPKYKDKGVQFGHKTLRWVEQHAKRDDRHPREAMELIKVTASSPELRDRVRQAAKSSLECYALALSHSNRGVT